MLENTLEGNTTKLRAFMKNSSDLTIKYAQAGGIRICVAYCDGQVDTGLIADLVYRPLDRLRDREIADAAQLERMIGDEILLAGDEKPVTTVAEAGGAVMSGFCVIMIDGAQKGFAIGVQGFETRSVTEPMSHRNVRGSREGFVEAIRTNMSLVRRRVKSPDLVFRMMKAGKLSYTDVCVCYIEKRADKRIIDKVISRIESLPLTMILDSGYIQPFLEENKVLFSGTGTTERPDLFAAKLYEGKVGVLVDGTPFALTVPKLFTENFNMLDDYLEKPFFAGAMRILRYISFLISVLLPGVYVALADHHPELIPNTLLINLAAAISSTPYPLLIECIMLDLFYEIMREAGLRLPVNVGHAVSIVGGIVIGDIVVSTGLAGAPTLVVVALASICGYIISDLYNVTSVLRFIFIVAGGMFGLFGLTAAGLFCCLRLCSMNDYGIPFTAPVTPFYAKGMRDTFIRAGWRRLTKTDLKVQELGAAEREAKENG